jgi:hypothetical protein
MRILCAIVEPTADLVPLGSNADLVHRRRICPKPVGDDAARSPVFLDDPLEKLQRRGFVSLRGSNRFQDLALMVDCAPQIAELAVDLHKHLIQMPAPLRIDAHVRDASLTNLGGEHRAKPVPPEPDGLVADVDPALGQQILDVSKRQRVSHVHHHDQIDDLWRAVEISERIAHAPRLTQPGQPRICPDTTLGKALQRDATEAIVKAGGSVLGSVSHPLGATDFGSYLLQAQASGAKVIALADTGADAINAIRQAAEFQIVGPDRRLAALFLQITDIDALGLNAAQGLILSEAFYWDLNDQTRAFAARFAERMGGKMPTEDQAAAYSATLAYLRAVKTAGTIEGDKVVAEMKKSPIDDPLFGHVVVRADGRATHAMYVFKVKSPQQSKSRYDVYDLIETIPPEAAFRPLDQGGCSLVK